MSEYHIKEEMYGGAYSVDTCEKDCPGCIIDKLVARAEKAERERDELREKLNEEWKIVQALEAGVIHRDSEEQGNSEDE